jgi:hypothetical protein
MTTAAKTIQSSPLAPYMELMKSVDVNVMHAVVEYLNETIREIEEAKRKDEDEYLAKKMEEYKASIGGKWSFDSLSPTPAWDTQKAWGKLTEAQREQAEKLNLSSRDFLLNYYRQQEGK